jgi:hypothetical protein
MASHIGPSAEISPHITEIIITNDGKTVGYLNKVLFISFTNRNGT